MYRGIILDCDGVILNSEPLHLQARNEALKDFGISFNRQEYYSNYIGLSDKESMRIKLERSSIKFTETDLVQIVKRKKQAYLKILANLKTVPFVSGVQEFIRKSIKEGTTLGVCSSSSREEVLLALKKLDEGSLFKYFETIVTIEDIINGKPSPEGYCLACKNISENACDCLAIEDSPTGVAAAISAGLSVYALLTTHKISQLQQATRIYNSFSDLNIT